MAAFWCFRRLHWKPSEYLNLPISEKAGVLAVIEIAAKQDAELQKKTKT